MSAASLFIDGADIAQTSADRIEVIDPRDRRGASQVDVIELVLGECGR